MEPHSALENAMTREFAKCKNRKEVRAFVKRLSKKERKFLQGELEYKMLMRQLTEMQLGQDLDE